MALENEVIPEVLVSERAATVFKEACRAEGKNLEQSFLRIGAKSAYPDREFTPPPPPAEVQEVSSVEASEILKNQPEIAILDVRPPEERAKAALDNSRMLDNHTAQEILDSWDPETPMMLICHQGIRSRQAAQYFTSQGFQQVYNVSDGIDGWSQTVDSSIPRY